ncbi:MAG: hypothetical protein WAS21_01740 [Geminicoccaceae bacterium]
MNESMPAAIAMSGPAGQSPLLPWEDETAFAVLRDEFLREYRPASPTERHLVEQLSFLFWRKRRVLEAERALHLAVLHRQIEDEGTWPKNPLVAHALACETEEAGEFSAARAVRSTVQAEANDLKEIVRDEAMTGQALAILSQGGRDAYKRALAALEAGTQQWWADHLDNTEDADEEECWRPTAASLRQFLENEVAAWYRNARAQVAHNPAIRRQAFGESLDPDRATKLQAYDLRLDRQIERTLAMLLKLQEVRRNLESALA